MKVLVMGGSQFNGLALVRELVRRGHDVTILNRGKTQGPVPESVRRLVGDRGEPESIRAALGNEDFDCVHDVSAYRLEDVKLMSELLRGRCGHYVFISSTVIYAQSELLPITEDFPVDRSEKQNDYGMQKLLCEDHLVAEHRASGFPASVVALSMVFGPRNILPDREQRMFARLLAGRPVLVPGDGTTIAQVGYVEDQACALAAIMGEPRSFGKRYNLTGSDAFSANGYVDTFARILGVEPNVVHIPPALMDDLYQGRVAVRPPAVRAKADTRTTIAASELALTRFQLSMLVQRLAPNIHPWNANVVFSVDRLRRDVGWMPKVRFPDAVERTWEWFQRERLDESLEFDFGFEDELLRLARDA